MSNSENGKNLSLRDYVEAFYTRKQIFLIAFILTPCIAVIVSFLVPRVYQASTRIWAKELRSGDPFRIEETRLSFLKDQQELILSNVVASRVLEAVPPKVATGDARKTWSDLSAEQQAERIVALRKNIEVEIDPGSLEGGSSFILIKVRASTASQASQLANLLAANYIDYYYELKRKGARDSYEFLETQKDEVAAALDNTERKLRDFEIQLGRKLIPLIELIKQGTSASFSEAYRFIGAYDIYASDWAEKAKGLELLQDLRKETGGRFVPMDSSSKNLSLIHLRDNLVNLRLKLAHVKQRRTERFDDVGMLQSEVAYAENMLKGRITEDFESRTVEKLAAQEKLDFMERRVRDIEKDLAEIADNRVTYEQLRREVDNTSAIYKKVQEELESARIAAQMSIHKTANIYVIDKAVPPLKAVRPNKILNLVLGILGGIVIGLGLVMISAYLDQTISRPEQVSRRLGLDVLGSISYHRAPAH